jgi:hypothetical protein
MGGDHQGVVKGLTRARKVWQRPRRSISRIEAGGWGAVFRMRLALGFGLPPSSADGSVHLTAEQARELHQLLSECRHNVNNCVSLIMSAMELAQLKPDSAEKMMRTATDQSKKVAEEVIRYSEEFERVMLAARSQG